MNSRRLIGLLKAKSASYSGKLFRQRLQLKKLDERYISKFIFLHLTFSPTSFPGTLWLFLVENWVTHLLGGFFKKQQHRTMKNTASRSSMFKYIVYTRKKPHSYRTTLILLRLVLPFFKKHKEIKHFEADCSFPLLFHQSHYSEFK